MERKQIVKLCVSGVVLAMSVPYVCGVFSGGDLTYELPKINRKVQDGTYVAQKTNNFSTVQVDMTISDHEITDCTIQSWGESDLMTDEIRGAWASAIVESQSGTPDAITGATLVFSAGSVQEAVADIMAQAAGEKEPDPIEPIPEPNAGEQVSEPAADSEPASETMDGSAPASGAIDDSATASETADDGIARLMRPRPALGAAEAKKEASEGDGSARLMRPRPALGTVEAKEEALEGDGIARLMRPRPALGTVEAKEEAPEGDDTARLMRPRPALGTVEAKEEATEGEDTSRLMRPRPTLGTVEEKEEAPEGDESARLMRPRPAI